MTDSTHAARWTRLAWFLASAATVLAPAAVLAQQDAQRRVELEEIVVTARNREENLQAVPLAITALSVETLTRANVATMDDLAKNVPGLSFQDVNRAYQNPVIRGLAQTQQIAIEGNVGVFLDGVFLDNRSGLEFGVLEMERVEVVKGPQSALYGRNTFAGAINYVTRPPSLDEVGGRVKATLGNYKRREISGSVNMPLGNVMALRVSAGTSEFDGTTLNVRNGERLGGWNRKNAVAGSLSFQPDDKLQARMFGIWNKIDLDGEPLFLQPNVLNNCGARVNVVTAFGRPPAPINTLFCGDVPKVSTVNLDPRTKAASGDTKLISGSVSYDFGGATAVLRASHQNSGYAMNVDTAGNPLSATIPSPAFGAAGLSAQTFISFVGDASNAESYELRIESAGDRRLTWMIGGYYYDSVVGTDGSVFGGLLANPQGVGRITSNVSRQRTKGKSAFASASYEVMPSVRASVEGRYTDENKSITTASQALIPGTSNFTPLSRYSRSGGFDFFTPRFILDYQAGADMLLYASASKGVKTGGFNTAVDQRILFPTFGPEKNWAYEIGAKTTWFDGRARVNVALYHIDWTDMQIESPISALSLGTALTNSAAARSRGFEIDTTFVPFEDVTLNAALAYTDPKFKSGVVDASLRPICGVLPQQQSFVLSACTPVVSGKLLPRISKWQANVNATYTVPELIPGIGAYLRADYSFQSPKFNTSFNDGKQGQIELANVRIGFTRGSFDVALWVDNVFDDKWTRRVTVVPSITATSPPGVPPGTPTGVQDMRIYPGSTRTFGVTAIYTH
jgi:iron complex outermembrane receptor protein